jgi:hypothetical protein
MAPILQLAPQFMVVEKFLVFETDSTHTIFSDLYPGCSHHPHLAAQIPAALEVGFRTKSPEVFSGSARNRVPETGANINIF